jgi:hypothetical protein
MTAAEAIEFKTLDIILIGTELSLIYVLPALGKHRKLYSTYDGISQNKNIFFLSLQFLPAIGCESFLFRRPDVKSCCYRVVKSLDTTSTGMCTVLAKENVYCYKYQLSPFEIVFSETSLYRTFDFPLCIIVCHREKTHQLSLLYKSFSSQTIHSQYVVNNLHSYSDHL